MAERKPYTVTISGIEHTLLLTDESAKQYGDAAVEAKADKPATKSRTPKDKARTTTSDK